MESMIKEDVGTLTKADQLLLFACDCEGVVVPDMIADQRCTYTEGRVVEVGCRVFATGGSEKWSRVVSDGPDRGLRGWWQGRTASQDGARGALFPLQLQVCKGPDVGGVLLVVDVRGKSKSRLLDCNFR